MAMKTKFERVGALAAAVAIASLGMAGVASADPQAGFNVPDSGKPVSLTLHKHEGDQGAQEYTGKIDKTTLGNPVAGVKFKIQQVGTMVGGECVAPSLQSAAGWEAISKATIESVCEPKGATSVEVVTKKDGSTERLSLKQGLYKVTETDPGTNLVATAAVPFLVALPMPIAKTNEWDYDVVAYPKNELTTPGKITKEAGEPRKFIPGTVLDWTVKTELPKVHFAYTEISLIDSLPDGLKFDEVVSVKFGGTLLEAGDFDNAATIKLSEQGLKKVNALLQAADKALDVVVVLRTEVTKDAKGALENEVRLSLNGKPGDPGKGKSYWGTLELTKREKGTSTVLPNALFSIYLGKCEAVGQGAKVIAEGLKTNADGKFTQTLYVGTKESDKMDYCVKETAAPAGYILDPTGVDVTLTATDVATVKTVSFDNVKVTGPDLPLTGAQGTALLTGAGLLLFGLGAGAVYAARRRS
ncbi:SpaH/EbpB family LPXTG-anchored major pilin [Trueperella pecoris]|uniref:SpaH/EbpB family LPXTG-anchored major pilin n=1 Tax=Trueperella pecoris TaxID=2733571 RepID=UPI00186B7E4D|nr:SpaH/EbpB family LPXTG-anchored major pilin [Trueperella pecoris]QOQ39476.1 SpaH/EbpB family LPXTG-anchored major pilin [Trueperella pecoris]